MRPALSPLSPMLALPFAVWACSGETVAGPDAAAPEDARPATSADARAADDAAATAMDAGADDAALAFPDASGMDATVACAYPPGATEPMAHDQVLTPYRWATALTTGDTAVDAPLDLTQVFCNTDPNRDWARVDVLLFVTGPSW